MIITWSLYFTCFTSGFLAGMLATISIRIHRTKSNK